MQFGCGYLETALDVWDQWNQCYHFWYFNMTTDVLFSDEFLMFSRQIWCWLGYCFCFPHLDSRFLNSFHQFFTLVCVWLSFQTKEALFAALRLTFYVNYKWLLHLNRRDARLENHTHAKRTINRKKLPAKSNIFALNKTENTYAVQ